MNFFLKNGLIVCLKALRNSNKIMRIIHDCKRFLFKFIVNNRIPQ